MVWRRLHDRFFRSRPDGVATTDEPEGLLDWGRRGRYTYDPLMGQGLPTTDQGQVEYMFRVLLMPPGPMSSWSLQDDFDTHKRLAEFDGLTVVDGVFAALREPTFYWAQVREDSHTEAAFVLAGVLSRDGVLERLADNLDDDRVRGAVAGAFSVASYDARRQRLVEPVVVEAVRSGRYADWDDDELVSIAFVLGISPTSAGAEAAHLLEQSPRWTEEMAQEFALGRRSAPPPMNPD